MQRVAAEMNLAETAFLVGRGDGGFDLRWFTPLVEVSLCGHATLASAHALWTTGRVAAETPIAFETLSGTLRARPAPDGGITIDLPARPVEPATLPESFARALGVAPTWCGAARKGPGGTDYLVRCATEPEVVDAKPDFRALSAHEGGIILTAAGRTPGWDVVSRYFVPAFGIDEDPVTGSAHCALATYWAGELGRPAFVARQASPRGGTLGVRLDADRVHLTGQAVMVLRGELID
jgi:PhzF family phenazine biosynthesis protein